MPRTTFIARHFRTQQPVNVTIEAGHYTSVTPVGDSSTQLPWIMPGLVDPQINGFAGVDFNREPRYGDSLHYASERLKAEGCTHFLATIITQPRERYYPLLSSWAHQRTTHHTGCCGFHLEGPFLNPDVGTRGVHCAGWMYAPDHDFLAQTLGWSHRAVRMITLAPEMGWPESLAFIRHAVSEGVRISGGHSILSDEQLHAAMNAGLSAWTHLGNGSPATVHKFENLQFRIAGSSLPYVFLIPDGIHVPPAAFRVLARALGDRLLLTTDAISGANAAPGRYTLGNTEIEVQNDGRAVSAGTARLAGSTISPLRGVFRAAELSGLAWQTLWDAASTRVATWLGWQHDIVPGAAAAYCLLDSSLDLASLRVSRP